MHSKTVHFCEVPLITIHFVRLGSFCGVLLLGGCEARVHYVKGDLEGHNQGEVKCWEPSLHYVYFILSRASRLCSELT